MNLYSTRDKTHVVSFQQAVFKGLADDSGLYVPVEIPKMPKQFFKDLNSMTFQEISFELAKSLFSDEIPEDALRNIIDEALNFDIPLVELDENLYVLELFHGPTLAFKDVAARFMSKVMAYFVANLNIKLTILVATSGDTGSAVAHSFLNTPGIQVFILYPSGRISHIQEQQLTTMGGNIKALEIQGSFDDCQRLAKKALVDPDLNQKLTLSSANSINIARLIPQSFYFFYAYSQLRTHDLPIVFSVPSGNFGNLTGGLLAHKMGLPVLTFVATTNMNDVVPRYLESGLYEPQKMKMTISNAMDVGNPSNFDRILHLYRNDLDFIKTDIWGASFTDEQTNKGMIEVYNKYKYILDPHGAVGYLGIKKYLEENYQKVPGIFLETAHPAKFLEIVQKLLHKEIEIPERLRAYLDRKKEAILLPNSYDDLKQVLLNF
jgi:threonine synthase